ncbi:lytic transglycosylase domain-containing protein [Streptomyces sp. NPDC048664]|uniref:lytic transglycosylase domain-containing protein n=1 Tax=Streptomyces sp. NPDC048664 TaxID=3154505 RepID=UPI00342F5023
MAVHFGARLRKGATTTAVAAAAVAALAASQAPGAAGEQGRHPTGTPAAPDIEAAGSGRSGDGDGSATGNSRYYTDLPPLNSPTATPSPSAGPVTGPGGSFSGGIPATVLDAYQKAEAELRRSKPQCNLPWQLLAAIGKVESGQAEGGRVDADGTTYGKILGPVLNGDGFASIPDTDGGAYDGDSAYDRAVGPMQFIPSTWRWAGRDGNGDGVKDPNNVYDAALAAGHYLCRADRDLTVQADMNAAILGYNDSQDYLNTVLSWYEYYRKGIHTIPDGTGALPSHHSDDRSGARPAPTPSKKHRPRPDTHKPAGGGTAPDPKPSAPGKPGTTTPPTPTDTVDHLADGGTGELSARTGDTFGRKAVVKAVTKAGRAVAKVRVRFTVSGDTDALFAGGEKVATVVTDASGRATAPALVAGAKTGDFKVSAFVVGRTVSVLSLPATVTERRADLLARTADTELTCTPGGEFADQVEVKATYKGAVADGVAATATLVTSADDPAENDEGPSFKDADGKPVRTLTGLKTDAHGLLKLPKLYADDTTGTFLLRVTTAGGATVTVELKVAQAAPSSDPTSGSSPTPSPSGSPSPSA